MDIEKPVNLRDVFMEDTNAYSVNKLTLEKKKRRQKAAN